MITISSTEAESAQIYFHFFSCQRKISSIKQPHLKFKSGNFSKIFFLQRLSEGSTIPSEIPPKLSKDNRLLFFEEEKKNYIISRFMLCNHIQFKLCSLKPPFPLGIWNYWFCSSISTLSFIQICTSLSTPKLFEIIRAMLSWSLILVLLFWPFCTFPRSTSPSFFRVYESNKFRARLTMKPFLSQTCFLDKTLIQIKILNEQKSQAING